MFSNLDDVKQYMKSSKRLVTRPVAHTPVEGEIAYLEEETVRLSGAVDEIDRQITELQRRSAKLCRQQVTGAFLLMGATQQQK